MMVGNKIDLKGADERLEILRDLYKGKFPIFSISAKEARGLNKLKGEIYKVLGIIRVYTKMPGKHPDLNEPIVLKKGSTVVDAAVAIHRDFAQKLKYARLWDSDKLNGQRVERGSLLKEGDILEFHI
ncbi:MAG: TGS domain-containing protein, partial [Candidatus Aerophobetes bacterium]|nr:TGS domain-containing protein [Candidatus Aerophobetes bacterium]